MITIRKYKDGDIEAIGEVIEPLVTEGVKEYADHSLYLTMDVNGKPMASGGLVALDEETAEGWVAISKNMCKESIFVRMGLLRALREALDVINEHLGFPMTFVGVLEGFTDGVKLAGFLGFKKTDQTFTKDGLLYHYYKEVR